MADPRKIRTVEAAIKKTHGQKKAAQESKNVKKEHALAERLGQLEAELIALLNPPPANPPLRRRLPL